MDEVRSLARMGQRFYRECTPGYYNSEGAAGNRNGFFSDMYGAGPLRFFEVLAGWRADGQPAGVGAAVGSHPAWFETRPPGAPHHDDHG